MLLVIMLGMVVTDVGEGAGSDNGGDGCIECW